MTAWQRVTDRRASAMLGSDPAETWYARAACRDADPELFHPERGTGPARERYRRQVAEAKAICQRCPSQVACLDFALTEGIPFGIFGGTTEDERRDLRLPPPGTGQPICGAADGAQWHRDHGQPVDQLCQFSEDLYRAQIRQETNA